MEVWSTLRKEGVNLTSFTLSDNLNHKSLTPFNGHQIQPSMHSWVFRCREKITAIRNSHMARNVSPIYSVIAFCRTAANSLLPIEISFAARAVKLNVTEDKSISFPQCHTDHTQDLLKTIVFLNSINENTIKSTTVLPIFICTILFL